MTHEAIVWSKPHPKNLTSLLNRASDWMAEHHLSFQQLHEKDVSIGVTSDHTVATRARMMMRIPEHQ